MPSPHIALRRNGSRWGCLLLGAALSCAHAACGRSAAPKPDVVVSELVEHLQAGGRSPDAARGAFELLSKAARDNLRARAERYAAASGRALPPERMIAPHMSEVAFEPRAFRTLRAANDEAEVEVVGLLEGERARVQLVWEEGAWKVALPLPALPPVTQRRPVEDR
jgi:hypothetical protein